MGKLRVVSANRVVLKPFYKFQKFDIIRKNFPSQKSNHFFGQDRQNMTERAVRVMSIYEHACTLAGTRI